MAIRSGRRARADVGTAAGTSPTPTAFRADPAAAAPDRPSRRQASALVATLALAAAAVGVASYAVTPQTARTFDLVHGSLFLTDSVAPVGIDLASGRPTLRLVGAGKQVGARNPSDISLVPVTDGTLMVDKQTGQFNMVDATGFVIKHDGGGVLVSGRTDRTTALAVAADGGPEAGVPGAAYIVRTGPSGTNVLLVNQTTVAGASGGDRTVQPRAGLSTRTVAGDDAGSVAAANGTLWVLFDAGADRHEIRQLSVPVRSDIGAHLRSTPRGTVTGPAAIGTAATHADGSGGTATAVAAPNRVVYYPADGSTARVVAVAGPTGADKIVSATGGRGRITFLEHGDTGWNLVSIAADGTGVRGPTPVTGLPASARPARPVWSNGSLYTIDTSDNAKGAIYAISAAGRAVPVAGATPYPIATSGGAVAENTDFSDAYLTARGTRVLINSPSHAQAVALFTDGARRPLIIRKSSAVDVSAAGGAEALTRGNIDPSDERGNVRRGQKDARAAGTQINNQVDCANTLQKPRMPKLSTSTPPGSRTVALIWAYPTLDPQDCIPSTYRVRIRTETPGSPSAGGPYTVQGQVGATITGLYPLTTYSITVTAYLHGQGTRSNVIRVTTGREGPAAPTGVTARADSSGNWVLGWNGCGSVSGGCVPVKAWRVVPSVCDGLGVSSPPTELTVQADSSARAQAPAVYRGGEALLGRGLRFQVIGVGDRGQAGDASGSTGCVYSWRPPDAGSISVSASQPANPTADGTTSITASVRFAHSATADLGGVGGTLTYQLVRTGGGVVDTFGPTTDTAVQLDNVAAGASYTVQVTASPPRHPDVVVSLRPAVVAPAIAPWPAVGLAASFDSDTATTGTLTVSFDLGGASARGEHFDLVNSSLTCGSYTSNLNRDDVTIGQTLTYPGLDRFHLNGDCRVTVQLQQNANNSTDPPVFGAGPSAVSTGDVMIPEPGSTATAADFAAQWGADPDHPQVVVSYSGKDPETLMSGWTLRVSNPTDSDCGSSSDQPTATIDVQPSCITAGGPFSVSIDYTYLVLSHPHFDIGVGGTAPQPLDPSKISFDVAWGGDASTPTVNVTYTGSEDKSRLSSATWKEQVTSPAYPGVDCGSDDKNPGFQVISVPVDLTRCAPGQSNGQQVTYTVTIEFHDIYDQDNPYSYDVPGDPPS